MKLRRIVIPLIVTALLLLATPDASFGQSASPPTGSPVSSPTPAPPTFGVAPDGATDLAPIRLSVDAGSSAEASLIVSNSGHAPIQLKTFAVPVTTAVNGGYQVLSEGNGSHGQVSWLSLPNDAYTLAPGKQIDLSLRVTVPDDTAPGEYMAALATEPTTSAPVAGSGSFRQIIRKVNAVVITVPGPVHASFELGTPTLTRDGGATTITVPLANTGNARLHPTGTITLQQGQDGHNIEIPVALNSIYAWDTTTIQQTIDQVLPDGEYTVTIDLNDEATGATAHQSKIAVLTAQPPATPAA